MGGWLAGRASCTEFRPDALCTSAFSLERHGLAGRSGLQSHSVPAASVRDGSAPSATAACLADGVAATARRACSGPIPNATPENTRAAMASDTRATRPDLGRLEPPFEAWGTVRLSTTPPSQAGPRCHDPTFSGSAPRRRRWPLGPPCERGQFERLRPGAPRIRPEADAPAPPPGRGPTHPRVHLWKATPHLD